MSKQAAAQANDAQPSRLVRFWFTADLRSAGLFRILLGLTLIWHWVDRWRWFDVLYAADGVLPGSVLSRLYDVEGSLGLFTPLGWLYASPWAMRGFFLAALGCFLVFLVGYRTRLFGLLSLLALASIVQRNPYCLIGADFVLGSLMLWAQFLPLGRRFSVDALLQARAGVSPPRQSEPLIGAFGVVLQIGLIYFFTAAWKTVPMLWGDSVPWLDGTAIHYVLHMEQSIRTPAVWVRDFPLWFIQLLSYGTLIVEFAAAPMILLPWGQPYLRRFILLPLIGLHLGIAVTLDAGLFSYVMFASYAILLTTADWERLKSFSRSTTVYYDDNCGVCKRTCEVLASFDRFGRLTFIGSSDPAAWRHDIPAGLTEKTVVVFDDQTGEMYTRAGGMAAAIRGLPLWFHPFRLISLPGIRWLSNLGYDCFARNRHHVSAWLGLTACGVPQGGPSKSAKTDGPRPSSAKPALPPSKSRQPSSPLAWWFRPINIVAIIVLVAVLAGIFCHNVLGLVILNLEARDAQSRPAQVLRNVASFNSNANFICGYPGAWQSWNMFAPNPPSREHWWVADAKQADGGRIDPMSGERTDFITQPSYRQRRYQRTWAAYLQYGLGDYTAPRQETAEILRGEFCRYLVQTYNRQAKPEKQIVGLDLYHVRLRMPPAKAKNKSWWPAPKNADHAALVEQTITPNRRHSFWPYRDAYLLGSYDAKKDVFEPGSDDANPRWLSRVVWFPSGEMRASGMTDQDTTDNEGPWDEWDADGKKHQGEYADGKRTGVWKHYHPEGWLLDEDTWQDGQATGTWKFYDHQGHCREIAQLDNGQRHGEATRYYQNNILSARGNYHNDKQDGLWTFWHRDGTIDKKENYRGGLRHGERLVYHANERLAGRNHYNDGVLSGKWVEYFGDGKTVYMQGAMLAGRRHGEWKRWHAKDALAETGTYQHGVKDAVWKTFSEAGARIEETYRDGQLDGPYQEFDEQGVKIQAGQYADGDRTGEWTIWHPNKTKWRQGHYKDGLQSGVWHMWYEDGARQGEFTFRAGSLHGPSKTWHPDGATLQSVGDYVNGVQHGVWTTYHSNTQTKEHGTIYNGQRVGVWKTFDPVGSTLSEGKYVDGKKHGPWKTRLKGKLVPQTYEEGVLIDPKKM